MNGEPLPISHGFPVRVVVPGLYGYVSATKWVVDMELTTFAAYDAYWVVRGWAQQAPIKTESRIDVPRGSVSPGQRDIAGVAWAQHTGIEAVEVQIDDGAWLPAELAATGHHRYLAPMALPVGRDAGRAPDRGARHRSRRRGPDARPRRAVPGRRDGLPHGLGVRALSR